MALKPYRFGHVHPSLDHHQPGRDRRAFPGNQPLRRQSVADAWRIPGLSGAGGTQLRYLSRNGTDAVGNATTTGLRIPGDEYQENLVAPLARLTESGKSLLGSG
jgi:hypothetical protein